MGDSYRTLSSQLWSVIDEEINWSFNFFFHNRKLRRVLFLTCRADCKISTNDDEDEPVEYTNNYLTFEG